MTIGPVNVSVKEPYWVSVARSFLGTKEIPGPVDDEAIERRFWAKVNFLDPSGCWTWTAHRMRFGHGLFRTADRHGKSTMRVASRVAFEFCNGPIADDNLCVCHRCDNPPCCNPDHMFLGTRADNNRDCKEKGRLAVGERVARAKLTAGDVGEIRRLRAEGLSYKRIAPMFSVSWQAIQKVSKGMRWNHV